MRISHLLSLAICLLASSAHAESNRYIDLSHAYDSTTLNWPSTQPFKITNTILIDEGYYVSARDFASNEHTGTHVDAPNHFSKGRMGVSDIPLSRLIGPAVKIDLSSVVQGKPDYLISIADFTKWEAEHGRILPNTIVLLSTGYGKFWPNFAKYAGAKKPRAHEVPEMHFPGLDPAAARWLVTERKVKAIGIDTFSIDRGKSVAYESHRVLTANDVPIFENVADMSVVPASNFTIYALPMKIKQGTGAPLRIIAEIN